MPYASRRSCLVPGLLLFSLLSLKAQTTSVLRVMTANLTSGNAQKYESPGLDILKGLQPDIVAIQEFNYSNNAPADFRQVIDETFGAGFSYFRETNSGFSIPNGIISRYPILEAGSWTDPVVSNRGFAWARIALPGTNDLYLVSVHLYSSGTATDRDTEAMSIKNQVQASFPADAWVIVGGDFNTSTRTEAAVGTFKTFLSDDPIPTDAESGGNPDTNENRNSPYDYLLITPNSLSASWPNSKAQPRELSTRTMLVPGADTSRLERSDLTWLQSPVQPSPRRTQLQLRPSSVRRQQMRTLFG